VAITYYQRSTNLATDVHVATGHENELNTTTAASANEGRSVAAGASEITHVWTTGSGVPGITQWGSGTYRAQFNVAGAGANSSYGLRTVGSANGHFARVDSGLTSDLETAQQSEAAFTGTGLKLVTTSWTPSAGSTTDCFEIALAAENTGTMGQTINLTMNTTDSFADGPFDDGGEAPARTPQRTTTGVGT
jgi:hypothetical protein